MKVARTVLRGEGRSDTPFLPDILISYVYPLLPFFFSLPLLFTAW